MYVDYSFCQAAKYGTKEGEPPLGAWGSYDVACQWWKQFLKRVTENPTLTFDKETDITFGVGKWHLAAHVKECFCQWSLNFIKGVGHMDGETMETVWSQLNPAAISARSMTLGHRRAELNKHIGDINFKKMISIGTNYRLNLTFAADEFSILFQMHYFVKSGRKPKRDIESLRSILKNTLSMLDQPIKTSGQSWKRRHRRNMVKPWMYMLYPLMKVSDIMFVS